MKFELEPHNRNIPDDVLIKDIIEVAARLGRNTLTQREYEAHGKFAHGTFDKRFGSWINVLKLANLGESCPRRGMSKKELFDNLREVWVTLGRQPKREEMRRPLSKFSGCTYEYRFGTWRKALESFVKYANDISPEDSDIAQDAAAEAKSDDLANANEPGHKTKREISGRLRFSILLRDGFRCCSCGRSPITCPGIELQVDHILPWSKGGETVRENLQTKCRECNIGKGNAFDK